MKGARRGCYRCGCLATTREHFPPKSFFPKGGALQLKTVPSCVLHNNKKSHDDVYVLAHICINAANEDNLPKKIFRKSIQPQLKQSGGFRSAIAQGSEDLPDGSRKYLVNVARLDEFFDALTCAVYFDKFNQCFDENRHRIRHSYLDLISEDPAVVAQNEFSSGMMSRFFKEHAEFVQNYEADKIDDVVYANKIIAPGGTESSITIAHTFYGIFRVMSYLTVQWNEDFVKNILRHDGV